MKSFYYKSPPPNTHETHTHTSSSEWPRLGYSETLAPFLDHMKSFGSQDNRQVELIPRPCACDSTLTSKARTGLILILPDHWKGASLLPFSEALPPNPKAPWHGLCNPDAMSHGVYRSTGLMVLTQQSRLWLTPVKVGLSGKWTTARKNRPAPPSHSNITFRLLPSLVESPWEKEWSLVCRV